MKRWIALFLVLLLTATLLSACAKNETASDAAPDESEPAPTAEPATSDGTAFQTFEKIDEAVVSRSGYTRDGITSADAEMQKVVAKCGDYELTNGTLQVYYWMQYYNFIQMLINYGFDASMAATYMGIDVEKPLSEQQSMAEGLSWEQYFLDGALEDFRGRAACATYANANGFRFSDEEQARFDTLAEDLDENAAGAGYSSTLEFVQETFGPGVTVEDYLSYVRLNALAGAYLSRLYEETQPTEAELEAYFDAHEDTYAEEGITKDSNDATINVRHILITPSDVSGDTDEEKQANARAEAERILAEYLESPGEDSFAAMANLYSTDPGSNTNGGLYEGVYPGQMVPTFNDWCFDESRQPGDTGIVETDYGYHVMYFVGKNDLPRWMEEASADLRGEQVMAKRDEIAGAQSLQLAPEEIVIAQADIYG